jgi:hypothetical protein
MAWAQRFPSKVVCTQNAAYKGPFGWILLSAAADRTPLTLFVEMQLRSNPTHGSVENAGSKRQSTNTQLKNFGLPLFRIK